MYFYTLLLVSAVSAAVVRRTAPSAVAPEVQTIPATVYANALAKKIRYGPFKMDAATKASGMGSDIQNYVDITMPCSECTLLYIKADIEYPDGSNAADVYAHHMSLAATGSKIVDATCRHSNVSVVYNIGNERTGMAFTNPETNVKSGFYVAPGDKFILNALLWNGLPVAKEAYVTMDYQYLPGAFPEGFAKERSVWMSVAQGHCEADDTESARGAADFAPPNKEAFTSTSNDWVSPYTGTLMGAVGHMHDGGTKVTFFHNNVNICESNAIYDPSMQLAGGAAFTTLKAMSLCNLNREVKKGDAFRMSVDYDFRNHMGLMEDDGGMSTVMGSGLMFIAEKV